MISELKTCTSGGLVFPVAMFRPDDTLVMNSRPRAAVLYFPEDVADEAAIEKMGTFFMSVGYQMFAVLASIRPGEELAVAASAAAFIRRNAAEFGTDPDLIIAFGSGKAALPVAFLALCRGQTDPEYGDARVAGAIVEHPVFPADFEPGAICTADAAPVYAAGEPSDDALLSLGEALTDNGIVFSLHLGPEPHDAFLRWIYRIRLDAGKVIR